MSELFCWENRNSNKCKWLLRNRFYFTLPVNTQEADLHQKMKILPQKEGILQSLRKRSLQSGSCSCPCPAGASDHHQKSHRQMDLPLKVQKKVKTSRRLRVGFSKHLNERLNIYYSNFKGQQTKTNQRSLQMDLVHRKIPWRHHLDCGMWIRSGHRCSVFLHLLFKWNRMKYNGQWNSCFVIITTDNILCDHTVVC